MKKSENNSLFGQHLKKLRERKRLKLYELAVELKVDSTLLNKYEKGTRAPKRDKLQRIAKYFSVGLTKLAQMISQDKQKAHYQKLSSESENKH